MVTQNLVIHMIPDGIRPKVYLSQKDTGYEKLRFSLVGTNDYYEVPSGSTVLFVGTKRDKKMFSYACIYTGHEVTCDVTEQMTAVPGTVECELKIINTSGNTLGSINIDLEVERSPLADGVCSCNDFKSADDEIVSIHQEVVHAKQYSNDAKWALRAVDSYAAEATEEMQRSVNSVHDYIVNGLVINYIDLTETLEFIV